MEIIADIIGVILSVGIVGYIVIGVLGLIATLVGNIVGLFGYIIILCAIAAVFSFFSPADKEPPQQNVNVTQQEENRYDDKEATKETVKEIKSDTDLILGKVYIGEYLEDVKRIMGNPLKISEPNEQGQIQYKFADATVSVTDGVVTAFVSENATLSTKRGIKQGDSLDKVIAQYGDNPYGNSTYGDTTLYEYKFISDRGDECLLRFAVKNDVVDYISGRVLNMGSQNINRH